MDPRPVPQLPHRPFPAVQYQWVADARSATAITSSILRASLWNKAMWVLYALLAVIAALQFMESVFLGLFFVAFLAVFGTLVLVTLWAYYRRGVKAQTAPGTVWATGFGSQGFVVIGGAATTVYDYAAVSSARRVGSIVLFRFRGDVMYEVIPSPLVPDHELDRLQRAARAKPA